MGAVFQRATGMYFHQALIPVSAAIDSLNVFLQQRCIVLLLHVRHANLEDGLLLGRQTLLHIRLQPPQQKWPQHLQQPKTVVMGP